jgi:hypothetical protein
MSKLIKLKIDLLKVKKEHLYKGEKGTYLDVDVWVNDEPDQYKNDCGVKQSYKVGDEWQSHYVGNGVKKSGWDKTEPKIKVEKAEILPESDDGLPF